MFKNYLITAWRNIVKNGVFSAINIFGLTVGLMSCILIMLFVREESGYDKWLTDSDRLARVHTAFTMPNQPPFLTVRSAGRIMEAIKGYANAEVETGVRIVRFGTTIQHKGEGYSEQGSMVDSSFLDVFDLPFTHGDRVTSFAKPNDLLITEEMALKYFGRTDVIGETMTFCCIGNDPSVAAITGVIKNLPSATHLDFDFVFYLNPELFANDTNVLHTWNSVNVYTYFKLNPGIELSLLQERVNYWLNHESPFIDMAKQFLGEQAADAKVTDFINLKLMSVPDIHLKAKYDAGSMGDLTPMGDDRMIKTFTIVAALVLLIACINFMNLSTAKASKRAKEVAMRKVVGASRAQVAIQFLSEALTVVFIALLFALAAAELVLPFYNQVIGKDLQLQLFDEPSLLLNLMLVTTVVGLGAGAYPAMYLSKFLPGHILKSSKSSESQGATKFRSTLVVIQFAMSIMLVIATIVVYGQTLYSNAADVGYRYHDKMVLNVRVAHGNTDGLKQSLLNLSGVTDVTFSSESPTQDFENNSQFTLVELNPQGEKVEPVLLNYHHMGYGFFESYGVMPIAGRLFDESYGSDAMTPLAEGEEQIGQASIILNRTAALKYGYSDPAQAIGNTLNSGRYNYTIIGVIPDLHFRSMKYGIRASAYMHNARRFRVANISFNSNDVPNLMEQVQTVWKEHVPMEPIDLQFLSEMMAAQYQDESTTAKLFLAFAVLAIIVACLGLYGLSAFTVERRTKEIGIRKVMGAGVTDIIQLLIWQFSKPVIIANIIAWPVAAYFLLGWLQSFTYRIDTWYLIPICASVGLLSLVIAWLTVGGNAAKVARKNPVKSLRYE
ncbi:ABC transporter permease [Thalassotalea atypica]|uniref:ABC transporter permease n=1 Tax=Thalassotalea atypica TaxID=2054316 RepID=UPI00257328A2|nr:ABC transporter permease [Thalassotalea atypica]